MFSRYSSRMGWGGGGNEEYTYEQRGYAGRRQRVTAGGVAQPSYPETRHSLAATRNRSSSGPRPLRRLTTSSPPLSSPQHPQTSNLTSFHPPPPSPPPPPPQARRTLPPCHHHRRPLLLLLRHPPHHQVEPRLPLPQRIGYISLPQPPSPPTREDTLLTFQSRAHSTATSPKESSCAKHRPTTAVLQPSPGSPQTVPPGPD